MNQEASAPRSNSGLTHRTLQTFSAFPSTHGEHAPSRARFPLLARSFKTRFLILRGTQSPNTSERSKKLNTIHFVVCCIQTIPKKMVLNTGLEGNLSISRVLPGFLQHARWAGMEEQLFKSTPSPFTLSRPSWNLEFHLLTLFSFSNQTLPKETQTGYSQGKILLD